MSSAQPWVQPLSWQSSPQGWTPQQGWLDVTDCRDVTAAFLPRRSGDPRMRAPGAPSSPTWAPLLPRDPGWSCLLPPGVETPTTGPEVPSLQGTGPLLPGKSPGH